MSKESCPDCGEVHEINEIGKALELLQRWESQCQQYIQTANGAIS
jgi:hypothetical protein